MLRRPFFKHGLCLFLVVDQNDLDQSELLQQIRRQINRASSHPRLIRAAFEGGKLHLAGPVLRNEIADIISAVSKILPIEQVDSRLVMLEPHPSGLLGMDEVMGFRATLLNPMHPALRTALGLGSAAAVWHGLKRSTWGGYLLAFFGFGGIVRAITNIETLRFKRELSIPVPISHAFSWWTRFENFAAFMSYVTEVTPVDRNTLHWTISGPGKIPLSWRASYKMKSNELLEWKSLPGSIIMNEGRVRFSELPNMSSTLLDVELSYAPPAGSFGYNVASAIGFSPKARINSDLAIMKELITSDYLKRPPWTETA